MIPAKLNESFKSFISTINSYFHEGIAGRRMKEIYINNSGFHYDPQPAAVLPKAIIVFIKLFVEFKDRNN